MTTNPDRPERASTPAGDPADPAPDPTYDPTYDPAYSTGEEPTTTFERPQEHTAPFPWEPEPGLEEPPARQLGVGYLVTGLVFLGIAGLWLAQQVGVVAADDLDLLVPLLLVVVGAAGLAASLAKAVRRRG